MHCRGVGDPDAGLFYLIGMTQSGVVQLGEFRPSSPVPRRLADSPSVDAELTTSIHSVSQADNVYAAWRAPASSALEFDHDLTKPRVLYDPHMNRTVLTLLS